jgi:outer membrane protein OmpA-like peptidoglycan-associated protein
VIVVDEPTAAPIDSADAPDAQPPQREKREVAAEVDDPDAGAMRVVVASSCLMYVLQQLLFAKKSSTLTQDATTLLDETAEVLKKLADVRVRIEGHTDDTEPKKLGQTRADEVRKELVQRGIDASRLTAANAGKSKPLTRGKSAEDRARNRRVEFYIEP